jgi:hypothetical protein
MYYRQFVALSLGCALLAIGQSASAAYDTVSPKTYNRLCPTWIGGDREYDGHGPDVTTEVTLRKNGAQILLDLNMHQIETTQDWSEAQYTRSFILTQARQGTNYNAIWAPNASGVWTWIPISNGPWQTFWDNYVDTNHNLRQVNATGISWLAGVDTNGDTGGLDIGNCTADDAYLNVRTNTIYVQY